jgi:hypothetical protein
MDPLTLITGASAIGGIVSKLFGTSESTSAAKAQAQAQSAYNVQQTRLEQQVEAQRMQAMEVDARRKQREAIRNQQRAQSMALTSATAQGAQFGSGLQGGYGQISGDTGTSQLGIQQALETGRNIFGINSQLSQAKIDFSQQTAANTQKQLEGQAWSSFGGSLIQGAPTFGKVGSSVPGIIGSLFS